MTDKMTYSKFITSIRELGFDTYNSRHLLVVEDGNRDYVLTISKTVEYSSNSNTIAFKRLTIAQRKALFNLVNELASTPLEEREDQLVLDDQELNNRYREARKRIEARYDEEYDIWSNDYEGGISYGLMMAMGIIDRTLEGEITLSLEGEE